MVSESDNPVLKFATDLVDYLGCQNLPTELIDDRKQRIDPTKRTRDELIMAHYNEDSLFSIKTVRFLKDFARYKAAPDLSTKNTSFLRTAEVFRQQGIKNYYFLLQLNNPMLKGVDPYAEDLTNEQRTWISEECRTNFWYFLREVCRLKPELAFMANRGNISFIWTYLNHITTYMIMPRQQGKMQWDENEVAVVGEDGNITWKKISELRTGDEIWNRHGKTSRVMGIHPQGVMRLYNVTMSDGRMTQVGAEHLWTLFDNKDGVKGDFSTARLALELDKKGGKRRFEVPLIAPIDGPKKKLKIHPYLMGLMYGAHQSKGRLYYASHGAAQDAFVKEHLPEGHELIGEGDQRIIRRTSNSEIAFDVKHGLPHEYLNGALEDRVALLHGLLDQSGSAEKGIVYRGPSVAVSRHVKYLVHSLGGTAYQNRCELRITLPVQEHNIQPFKFYSKAVVIPLVNKLFVERIDYAFDDNATCIEVDDEEQLYITDDFIVTHNTVSVQVINFWLTYINGRGYKSHLITLKSDNRAQFIDAVKKIRTCMPDYLVNPTWRDKDSGNYLNYKAFGDENVNTLTISVPQMGRDAAGDLGRGLTVETTIYDESGYINFIEEIINGCAPSALTAMENARKQGKPYGIAHITTPNTTLHTSGEFMFKKLMDATEWREKFFDSYSESHLKERLLRASPKKTTAPSVSMVYNYLQLGKDKEWVKETIDLLNLSISKAKIDLLLMWVEDGENRVFDDVTREAINNIKRDKVWSKEYRDSGLFMDFFVSQEQLMTMSKKEHNDFFLIGVDTSSAINKDACTLIIRSMRTGKVVGVGRYPLAFLDDVTKIIVDMLEVLQNSMLVIERNYAHHMIDNLLIMLPMKGMDPFTRIYNQIYQDPVNHEKEFAEVQNTKFAYRNKNFYLKFKQHFGFNTTSKSRAVLYGLLQEAVGVTGYGIAYDKLADELINLRTKGDRIDHDSKQHDDLVIAWLLTYWFIKLGANKPMYGIPTGIALSDVRNLLTMGRTKEEPKIDPSIQAFVDNLKKRINELTEELLNTRDNILALRLEAEVYKLSKMLPPETYKLLTIDQLLADAKVERSKRLLQNRRAA